MWATRIIAAAERAVKLNSAVLSPLFLSPLGARGMQRVVFLTIMSRCRGFSRPVAIQDAASEHGLQRLYSVC